ncbi:hypothetical protein NKR23_g232 [Pleurostoma richardsiae]|uniref:Fucose-specific lectin n=1 Tax=Pleurostoma richardsiae TaxID=41990 RepID=A0AA38W0Y2_9PEZI|nr:hypothetical protein NKR23_g232 [Pleurostoma richardsiae]
MSNFHSLEPGYSTLEVSRGPHTDDALKEVVPGNAPEILSFPAGGDNNQYSKGGAVTQTDRARRRIFCLSYRSFIIVVVITVVVVVGAIVGGVVGGISSRKKSTTSSTPTPTSTPARNLLSNSKLAASNYTDAKGYVHRSVFFQDSTEALIARLWDSQNNTWKTLNITQQLPGSNVLSGTPLASSSLDLDTQRIHTWCLLADQSIHGYFWNGQGGDPSEAATWAEEVSIGGSSQVAMTGSSLASAWQRPVTANSSSIGSWILAFQKQSGEIAVANYTGSGTIAVNAGAVASLTSLAMTSELTGSILSRLTLTYESNGNILKASYTGEWDTDADEHAAIFSDVPAPSSNLEIATTAFDHWRQILFLALLPNGTIAANWYDDELRPLSSIGLSGGPNANFSAIATTSDAMFYGIFNDSILQYSINTSNPQTFNYAGVVFP